jgi:hypothetical protein
MKYRRRVKSSLSQINNLFGLIILTVIFLILASPCFAQQDYLLYPAIVHLHSDISDGVYPLRKLVNSARDQGVKIIVLSDSFLRRWEYGLPILSNIFKVTLEENSVVKYGVKRYLGDLKRIKDEFPDMLIPQAVEVAPFYWWEGNFLERNLSLNDWNRHLLVIGLTRPQDYAHLPVVGNRYFLPQLKDTPFLLIPLAFVILGIFTFKRRPKKFLGITLSLLGILFLFNLWPFSASLYNPYHGQKNFSPHQDLVDYVNKKNGLVFWAHPEINQSASWGKFIATGFYTPSYPEALMQTLGYAGFGVSALNLDSRLVISGGDWDRTLISYCRGNRNQPVWAIAEADYRQGSLINVLQNVLLLPEFTLDSAYEALRAGRFYLRRHPASALNISLSDFHIEDSLRMAAGNFAFMGEQIQVKGKPQLRIKGNYLIAPTQALKIDIIRNGQVVKKFEFSNGNVFDLDFQDDSLGQGRRSYYRLNFFADTQLILVTNPIFVNCFNHE